MVCRQPPCLIGLSICLRCTYFSIKYYSAIMFVVRAGTGTAFHHSFHLHMLFQTDLMDVCSCYLVVIILTRLFRRSHGGLYWSLSLSLSLSQSLSIPRSQFKFSYRQHNISKTLFIGNKTKFFYSNIFGNRRKNN